MKRLLLFALMAWLAVACFSRGRALCADQEADTTIKDEVVQTEHRWGDALLKRDIAEFSRCLADEWVLTTKDGTVVTKPVALADLKEGALRIESFRLGDVSVRLYGDVAIVFGVITEKSKFRDQDTSGTRRVTDVFVKRDGRWQAVASHESDIITKK
jgi:ketosteroid isomerase-like protein